MKRASRQIYLALSVLTACTSVAVNEPAAAAGLPTKVGECTEATITAISDYWGKKLSARKQEIDQGVAIGFSNKGGQYSHESYPAVVQSKVGDKVKMCLISIPSNCPPGDNRGRVYKTTNLRTNQSWRLPDDIHSCGGA
jgi:hypothetical protein